MADLINGFLDKKKAESPFLSIEDGESVKVVQLKDIREATVAGYGGEQKNVLRLVCEVETILGLRDKNFDNGTQRFAKELQEKKVSIGDGFVITRNGLQAKTRYTITDITKGGAKGAAPAAPAA